MEIALSEQAYALGVLGGPPVFNIEGWCERIVALARAADVEWLLDEDTVRILARNSRELAAKASDYGIACKSLLLAEWLESSISPLKTWSQGDKRLYLKPEELAQAFQDALRKLNELGLSVPSTTRFEVVEQFPPPFAESGFSAFCPDPVDEKRFGIPAGIYLRRDRLRPFWSVCTVAHELVHIVPGLEGGDLLAMGLEEGIADLLGGLIVGHGILPQHVAENAFTYSRLGPQTSAFAAYLDHLRQAFVIYARYGVAGLVELLKGSRAAIHAAERSIIRGEMPNLTIDEQFRTPRDFGLIMRVSQSSLGQLVVSPTEYCVARVVRAGMTISDVAAAASSSVEVARQILNALAARTLMVVLSDDRVEFANFDVYLGQQDGLAPVTLRVDIR